METLFEKFGGIRAMAGHLGEPPSTVQSWKNAGRVPAVRQPDVLRKAAKLRLPVRPIDVIFPLGDIDLDLEQGTEAGETEGLEHGGGSKSQTAHPSSGNMDHLSGAEVAA